MQKPDERANVVALERDDVERPPVVRAAGVPERGARPLPSEATAVVKQLSHLVGRIEAATGGGPRDETCRATGGVAYPLLSRTTWTSVNSSMPSRPACTPTPLDFKPPNG